MMNEEITEKPLVSVIVPVYNAEKYLPACLDSICNQTLQELEIIVVDDGSTDRSREIADEYAVRDKRIKVVHKRNGNPGATRNVGLRFVTGEYVGFVDSDDWIEPEMFFALYRKAKNDNLDIVVTGVTVEFARDKREIKRLLNKSITVAEEKSISPLDTFFMLKEKSLFAVVYNKLYSFRLLENKQICFMEMLPYEDLVFNLKAFMFTKKIDVIPDNSPYHYICRDEMTAAGSFSQNHLQACKVTEDVFRQFFLMYNYNEAKVSSYLRTRRISDYSAYASGFYKKNSPLTRKERIACLYKEFVNNEMLKQDILLSPPIGFYQRMFYYFIFNTTPLITDCFYQFLFYMRYHFDPIYREFRRFISQ
mgnify:CR=1 FL=1